MAAIVYYNRDANMNSLGGDTSHMMNHYQVQGSPGRHNIGSPSTQKKSTHNRNGPGEPRRNLVPNMMTYRDPPRRRDSTPPRDSSAFRPAFEDFEDPPSPTGSNYRDDRIQNDLLDEICSDIGIKDATDLDIFDFDTNTDQYIINQTRLPDDLECLDETITFGDIQADQYGDFGMPVSMQKSQTGGRYGDTGQTVLPPINQRSVSDEVKSASQELANSDCLASPTVSSTCPGSQSNKVMPRPPSHGSAMGSPAIHSTSSHNSNLMDDLKDIRQLKKELQNNIKLLESPVPSPTMSCGGSNGPPSVECLGRFGPPSVNNDRSDVSSTTPSSTEDTISSCMLSSSPDKKPSFMKPGTPSKAPSCQVSASINSARPKTPLFSSCSQQPSQLSAGGRPQMSVRPLPSPHDPGYSSGNSVGTGSHYGSSHSLNTAQNNMDPLTKDKVFRFLDSQTPEVKKPVITCDQSSTSSSPPQHAAKRARIINNGNELLEEMRNRYACTKGVDMYVPNRHPNIDGSYPQPQQQQQQQPQQGFQRQFSNTPNMNFSETSCMKGEQPQQFNSCSSNGASMMGAGAPRPQSTDAYNNQSMMSSQQPYNQQNPAEFNNQAYKQESSQYPAGTAQQGSMYGSCPNLAPQGQFQAGQQMGARPYSPMNRASGPPVAQSRMSQGYNNSGNVTYGGQQYETPATSPLPVNSGNQAGMYPPGRNVPYSQNGMNQPANLNQPMSAPATPLKPGVPGDNSQGYNNQNQWSQNQTNNGQYPMGQGNMYRNANEPNMQMNPPMAGGQVQCQAIRGQYPANQQVQPNNMQPAGAVNMQQMRSQSPGMGPYSNQPMSSPHPNVPQNCRMMGPNGMSEQLQQPGQTGPQTPMQHIVPRTIDTQTPVSQQGFMQSIITDRSSAFRSHPLFPLLRDLIIADMNFHTPSFPFQLIANLPADFDRLLQNYLQRNPPSNQPNNEAVQGVIMDALKYAHSALIGKIQQRKQKEGYEEPAKPLSAIEDFCERFDRAVKNSMVKPEFESGVQDPYMAGSHGNHGNMGPPTHPAPHAHPDNMMNGQRSMMGMPMPHHHPGMNGMHSQSYQDLTRMGPGPSPYQHNPMAPHPHLNDYSERRANSLPSTPRKSIHGRIHDTTSETNLNRTGSDKNVSSGTGTGKSKVLPKESVALMMDWLRKHQDNPYPNDDEKEMLIQKTKLTINQINYWFTNARRRILPKWALQRYMEQQEKQKQIDQQQIGTPSVVH